MLHAVAAFVTYIVMDESDQGQFRGWLPNLLLMAVSFLVFAGVVSLEGALRLPGHGGPFFMITSILWVLVLLPWSVGVVALYSWRRWRRFLSFWVLLPAIIIAGHSVVGLIRNPPVEETLEARFARTTKAQFPGSCVNLRYRPEGGGLLDYHDVYCFETTSDEIDRLIREMVLQPDKAFDFNGLFRGLPQPGFPDFRQWPGVECYSGGNENGWFYQVITDQNHTRACVIVSCL